MRGVNECTLPVAMSALACALADGLTSQQIEKMISACVILTDSLASIALQRSICEKEAEVAAQAAAG